MTLVGTGFFLTADYFITAAHVINPDDNPRGPEDQIRIYRWNPDSPHTDFSEPLEIVLEDPARDLVVMKTPFKSHSFVRVSVKPVPVGARVALYGFPRATYAGGVQSYGRLVSGTISAIVNMPVPGSQPLKIYEAAVMTHPGNSGGPLFLPDSGTVIAVCKGQVVVPGTDDVLLGYGIFVPLSAIEARLRQYGVSFD
jgi:S1-C subfamily serine protease